MPTGRYVWVLIVVALAQADLGDWLAAGQRVLIQRWIGRFGNVAGGAARCCWSALNDDFGPGLHVDKGQKVSGQIV